MPEFDFKNALYGWRVRVGFICLFPAALLAKPNIASFLGGLAACSLGLLIRAWAAGYIKKEKELTVSGPYRYTRNPLYLGNLVMGTGAVISSRSWWILGIFAAYFLLFYPLIIKKEEEKMKKLFPLEYSEYGKKVPLLFPLLKSSPSPKDIKFNWQLYWKNREWRALAGAMIFWAILALKIFLL